MADIKYCEEGGKLFKIDSDGEKYRISFSEELQLKNIRLQKENRRWLKYNFYAKIALTIFILVLVIIVMFTLYRLDRIDFFTGILYR